VDPASSAGKQALGFINTSDQLAFSAGEMPKAMGFFTNGI
jgi:hypothetical protein